MTAPTTRPTLKDIDGDGVLAAAVVNLNTAALRDRPAPLKEWGGTKPDLTTAFPPARFDGCCVLWTGGATPDVLVSNGTAWLSASEYWYGVGASDLAAHVAASDPHPGYVLESTTSTTPTANFLPIANGSGKLAAGWISEVLALADLSDVTAKTGTGTTVVMSAAPSVTGVWSFNAGLANQGSLTFFDAAYGIGIDSSDLSLWANNGQGISFRQSTVSGALSGRITASGFGVGDVSVPLDRLHVLGNVRSASTTTDLANKTGAFVAGHRSNSEEPLGLIGGTSTATTSTVFIGGGTSALNAATTIQFYTAANNTTVTGTLAGQVLGSGTLQWLLPIYVQQAGAGTLALVPTAGDNSIQSSDPTVSAAQNLTLCGPSYATLSQIALRASTVYIVGTARLDGLTASQAVLTDGSKNLVSVAYTGSANVVRSTSASMLTPTITNATLVGGYFGGQPMFTSGCNSVGGDAGAGLYQVAFSYAWQDTYKHFLRTRHNGGAADGNAIDFFTCGGTSGGTLANAVLGLTIEGGKLKLGASSAICATNCTNFSERTYFGSNNGWPSFAMYSSANAVGFQIYDADVWKVGSINAHDLAFVVENVERIRIGTSGRVGIGTTDPWWLLTLANATVSEISLVNGSNVGAQLSMVHGAGACYLTTNGSYDLVFRTNSTERLRIAATGEVGIGCAPSSKTLSIGGDVAVGYRTTPDDTYVCKFLIGSPYHLADDHWYAVGFNANSGSNDLLVGWYRTTSVSLGADSSTTAMSPRVIAQVTYAGMSIVAGTFGVAGLTASQGILTDASKNLVSVALTGTGSLVRGTSPTIATPSLVDGAATVQLQLGTGYVSVENEIRFGGLSYSRLSYDVGNGAPWLGYNCKVVGSSFKHDSTGTLGGIRFTGNGDIFFYTDASAAANTTVTPQMSINASGVVGLTALTASKLVATNSSKELVSYDLVATDIPALTSSNAIEAAKGHRFWMHIAAADLGSALTQLVMPIGGIDSITYPTPLPRACKLVRISITAMHADSTTPPATWTVDVYKNGSSASTMTFNLNASPFADTTTSGNTSSTITFAADDRVGVKLTGTSLDALVARMSLEFETTS